MRCKAYVRSMRTRILRSFNYELAPVGGNGALFTCILELIIWKYSLLLLENTRSKCYRHQQQPFAPTNHVLLSASAIYSNRFTCFFFVFFHLPVSIELTIRVNWHWQYLLTGLSICSLMNYLCNYDNNEGIIRPIGNATIVLLSLITS